MARLCGDRINPRARPGRRPEEDEMGSSYNREDECSRLGSTHIRQVVQVQAAIALSNQ
jgi:hypothetical protein